MVDFDRKLQLKSMYTHLISIAIAKNDLIEQIFEFADREVDGTPSCELPANEVHRPR